MISVAAVFTLMLLSFALFHLCSISLKDLNDKFFFLFLRKRPGI